jgi:hypothetical protein
VWRSGSKKKGDHMRPPNGGKRATSAAELPAGSFFFSGQMHIHGLCQIGILHDMPVIMPCLNFRTPAKQGRKLD